MGNTCIPVVDSKKKKRSVNQSKDTIKTFPSLQKKKRQKVGDTIKKIK